MPRRSDPLIRKRCPRACDTYASTYLHFIALDRINTNNCRCKRRKERCDGAQPCGRCVERNVPAGCRFESEHGVRQRRSIGDASLSMRSPGYAARRQSLLSTDSNWVPREADESVVSPTLDITQPSESSNSIGVDHSRLLRDKRGRFMFIGDSANLSFLREIRVVINDTQGSCPFVDDPLRSCMVEATPDDNVKSFELGDGDMAPRIPTSEARKLIQQFFACTNGLIDLFDESDVLDALPGAWSHGSNNFLSRAIIYLILAIGAQNSPQDMQTMAETFFSRGRYLTAQYLTEDASIQTAQLYLLITVYLLSACRRNAAFICLGHAVRSAYALGVHQKSVSALFPKPEQRERERLWNGIRAVDLFTSASLGRPPSTIETRTIEDGDEYISNELYAILETILNDVYGRRKITSELLAKIGARQRQWAAAFGSRTINTSPDLNLGEMHLRQTYYWTIMLLTRPFLVDRVTLHAQAVSECPGGSIHPCVTTDPSRTLVHACVDSAVKTIALLEPLVAHENIPKHLPAIINAAFHSALILGFSYFGDLYEIFPLERTLDTAHKILLKFPHDSVASRNAGIIQYLRDACAAYYQKRHSSSLSVESEAISQLFGQIHEPRKPTRTNTPRRSQESTANGSESLVTPTESLESGFLQADFTAESDLLSYLGGRTDLDLNFPMTPQPIWAGSETDFASLFTMVDMADPKL